jgi:geranylgeranyl pyrophosphate synthase
MVGGQAVDLIAAGRVPSYPPHDLDDLELNAMHFRKTGALICAAAEIGGILNGADESTRAALHSYATDLGLAFQIIDDVLDVQASAEDLGKTPGKDAAAGKPTYVSRYGVEGAIREAHDCVERALGFLAEQRLSGRLPEIAEWTISRKS